MDLFNRYMQAFPTPLQIAKVISQTLWDKYFVCYSVPEKILSSQGCNFKSSLIVELCELSKNKNYVLVLTSYRAMVGVRGSTWH